jgi:ADP-ribose pyrophosphatase YjhB (NUDIX family)
MLKTVLSRIYAATPPKVIATVLRVLHPRFSVSVVGAFFTAEGKVLLLRHVYRHSYPWGLPSGFLSTGEDPEVGVLRELMEETGLTATTSGVISVTSIARRHLEIVIRGAIAQSQTPRISHEIFELGYFTVDDLPAAMPPGQRALVINLRAER